VQLGLYRRPELDTKNPPGQIRNDITLGDYVARKQEFMREEAKKLSFEEWYKKNPNIESKHRHLGQDGFSYSTNTLALYREIWETAQRNK